MTNAYVIHSDVKGREIGGRPDCHRITTKTRQNEGIPKTTECHYAQARVKAAGNGGAGAGKRGLGHAMVLGIECELDGIPN